MEPYVYWAKEFRGVKDGDTFVCDIDLGFDACLTERSIRIIGIDSPEKRTKNLKEKEAGMLVTAVAKKVFKDAVKSGCGIMLRVSQKSDSFGRVLADVFVSYGKSYSEYMLEHGLVKAYDGNKKTEWTDEELDLIIKNCNEILGK